jgi:ketosteroid isomerase-like protein
MQTAAAARSQHPKRDHPVQNDGKAIREPIDTWMRATSAGDLDQVLSLMAEDVVFLIPDSRPCAAERNLPEAFESRSNACGLNRAARYRKSDSQEPGLTAGTISG